MSQVPNAEVSMERSLPDMPYDILFEIFRRLPKSKLSEIPRLCSKFRDLVGDTRLWKDVYIKHRSTCGAFAFEELFSGPWPVKAVDFLAAQIEPPVSYSLTDQVVKVTKLLLPPTKASKVTMQAILAKYRCTELYLNLRDVDRTMKVTPEAFSNQNSLEVLSISGTYNRFELTPHLTLWLGRVLSNCKSLKFLNLSDCWFDHRDMMGIVKNLPKSLEKLSVSRVGNPQHEFYYWLAKSTPNLRELELYPSSLDCPALLEFQFLETIHIHFRKCISISVSVICMYIMNLPAVKTVYTFRNKTRDPLNARFEEYRRILEPLGITVRLHEKDESSRFHEIPKDVYLWEVTSAV